MRRILAALVMVAVLAGCREVRVNQQRSGTTPGTGGREVVVVRDRRTLDALGVAGPVDFRHEFAVVLLMGPHKETGWSQIEYRTYTIWIVPNAAYRAGARVEVVSPSGEPIASTTLR